MKAALLAILVSSATALLTSCVTVDDDFDDYEEELEERRERFEDDREEYQDRLEDDREDYRDRREDYYD